MTVVGSAEVIVRAIGNKVKSDIQKSFDSAVPAVGKSGDKAGATFGERMNAKIADSAKVSLDPLVEQADEAA